MNQKEQKAQILHVVLIVIEQYSAYEYTSLDDFYHVNTGFIPNNAPVHFSGETIAQACERMVGYLFTCYNRQESKIGTELRMGGFPDVEKFEEYLGSRPITGELPFK